MLAPAPPRCWTRSSTRKESETFSICPSTNCSTNFPGKVIRWSVAMEPVTTTGTERSLWLDRRECRAMSSAVLRSSAPQHFRSLAAGRPVRRRFADSVGKHRAQREPELDHPDGAEERPGRRPRGDDEIRDAEPGDDAGADCGETRQDH